MRILSDLEAETITKQKERTSKGPRSFKEAQEDKKKEGKDKKKEPTKAKESPVVVSIICTLDVDYYVIICLNI